MRTSLLVIAYAALQLAGCGASSKATTTPAPIALGTPLPELSLVGADGTSLSLQALKTTRPGDPPVIVLRHVAAWCGPCQWHAAHTRSLLPGGLSDRVRVVDVLLAGEDNGPPASADVPAWAARLDAPATVTADATFRLAALFPPKAALPLVVIVDARTLTPLAALSAPAPEAFTEAVSTALARIDGTSPPAATVPSLTDGRFDRAAWDLIRGMALGAPPSDPSNAYEDDPRAVALGKGLFFDGDLSPSPKKVSCGACHLPELLFQDGKDQAPEGVGVGGRNVPTVVLAPDQRWQFWDGRADSAWAQAIMPIEDPAEMGSTRLFVAHVVRSKYRSDYEAIFGALPALDEAGRFPAAGKPGDATWTGMAARDRTAVNRVFANVGKAIAAYERSLRPAPNALDRYAGGDPTALTTAEKDGLAAFLSAGCVQCHHGPRLTDDAFHALRFPTGRPDRTPDRGRADGIPKLLGNEFLRSGPYSDTPGAAPLTPVGPGLLGAFKTPGLRGVAFTLPYGHGGSFGGLTSTLEAHRTGGLPPSSPYAIGESEPWLVEFDPALIPQIETFLLALRVDLGP